MKEEIELKIANLQMEKDKIGKELTKEEIENVLSELEGIDIDTAGNTIDGEYKNFTFEIDEENRVLVGKKIEGEKPTGQVIIVTKEEGIEIVKLQVLVNQPKDGSVIESIEAIDKEKVIAVDDNDNDNGALAQMFEVSDNGYFTFRIKSSNRKKCQNNKYDRSNKCSTREGRYNKWNSSY